jgi:hypothetical protein
MIASVTLDAAATSSAARATEIEERKTDAKMEMSVEVFIVREDEPSEVG